MNEQIIATVEIDENTKLVISIFTESEKEFVIIRHIHKEQSAGEPIILDASACNMLLHDLEVTESEITYREFQRRRKANKHIAEYIYNQISSNISGKLKSQTSADFPNELLALGEQVVLGESNYWEEYVQTVQDMANEALGIPNAEISRILWENIDDEYIEYTSDGDSYIINYNHLDWNCDDITEEIFRRVCRIAEEEYEAYSE